MQATLLNYLSHYYTPQRMVLAGVGVDHDELVSLAEEHFVNQVRKKRRSAQLNVILILSLQ